MKSTSQNTSPSSKFFGWIWTDDGWLCVCVAPSIPECSERLHDLADRYLADCTIITAGGKPPRKPQGEPAMICPAKIYADLMLPPKRAE